MMPRRSSGAWPMSAICIASHLCWSALCVSPPSCSWSKREAISGFRSHSCAPKPPSIAGLVKYSLVSVASQSSSRTTTYRLLRGPRPFRASRLSMR
eukprot:5943489-Pyramimonas_sp.AAC.1